MEGIFFQYGLIDQSRKLNVRGTAVANPETFGRKDKAKTFFLS